MDRTAAFRDWLQTLASQQARIDLIQDGRKTSLDAGRIMKPTAKSSAFVQDAYQIRRHMVDFYHALQTTRPSYLGVDRHTKQSTLLNDQEKDAFDETAMTFLKTCTRRIQQLHIAATTPAQKQHQEAILQFLNQRLVQLTREIKRMQEQRYAARPALRLAVEDVRPNVQAEVEVSKQERMLLEEENDVLLAELTGTQDQVRQAEKSLLEIAQLQSTLETHVVSQYQDMTRLYGEAVTTTDTVRAGNVVLGKATRQGVEFRHYMLMLFLVLAFVLLFLHYYE